MNVSTHYMRCFGHRASRLIGLFVVLWFVLNSSGHGSDGQQAPFVEFNLAAVDTITIEGTWSVEQASFGTILTLLSREDKSIAIRYRSALLDSNPDLLNVRPAASVHIDDIVGTVHISYSKEDAELYRSTQQRVADVAEMLDNGRIARERLCMDVARLQLAIIDYVMDVGRLPHSAGDLLEHGRSHFPNEPLPLDQWGNPYEIRIDVSGMIDIWSYGKDGKGGGVGENADISARDFLGEK